MTTISSAAPQIARSVQTTPIEPTTPTEQFNGATTKTTNESMLHWGMGGAAIGAFVGGAAASDLGGLGILVGMGCGIVVGGGIGAAIGQIRASGTEHAKYIARLDASTGESTLKYAERLLDGPTTGPKLWHEADTAPHDATVTAEELAHAISRFDTDASGTLTGAEKQVITSDYWKSGFREPNPRH